MSCNLEKSFWLGIQGISSNTHYSDTIGKSPGNSSERVTFSWTLLVLHTTIQQRAFWRETSKTCISSPHQCKEQHSSHATKGLHKQSTPLDSSAKKNSLFHLISHSISHKNHKASSDITERNGLRTHIFYGGVHDASLARTGLLPYCGLLRCKLDFLTWNQEGKRNWEFACEWFDSKLNA